MKLLFKSTLVLLAFSAVVSFICVGAELSPALEILREEAAITKQCVGGKAVYFDAEDFGAEEIRICSLPLPEDGVLKLAGIDALPGQSVSASAVSLLKFVPSSHFKGEAEFSYSVGESEARCVIRYTEVRNMAPVATDSRFDTYTETAVMAPLDCYDAEGDKLSFSVVRWPIGGGLRFVNGCAVYTPIEGFYGRDSFVYSVDDGHGNCSEAATVTITVKRHSGLRFADMEGDGAAYSAVRLAERGVMNYSIVGGSYYFAPEETISRSEFAVMLVAATATPLPEKPFPTEVFTDTAHLGEHERFCIETVVTGGFLTVEDERFLPDEVITVADAIVMAERAGLDTRGVTCSEQALTKSLAARILD